ncbi:MAG TPA: response regulator [Chthoniobacter sp.]|nr:response regulator [Chthoniobacter sp.]
MLSIPHPLTSDAHAVGAAPLADVPVTPADETSRGQTVLIVDDDVTLRSTAALILESQGFKTLEAGNGLQALNMLERNPQVNAVLLDLLMPVMDGEETFRQLRQCWSAIPVIVISGFQCAEIARTFATPPPEAFVQKPFTFEKLVGTLGHILA